MLRLANVDAGYGPIQVLFGIDVEVGSSEIVALLGTNGAGKTTILRVISGVLEPKKGEVTWDGNSLVGEKPAEVLKRGIVQMPGGRGVFPGMSVYENLEIAGFLYGKDKKRRKHMIEKVFDFLPAIADRRHQTAGSLSGGEQQMLTLAKSFIMDPDLLLIDELSLGLAPKIVEKLLGIVRKFNEQGVAVLIVDQHVDLALDIASRAYFIERGQIRFSGPSEELRGRDDLLRSVFLTGAMTGAGTSAADASAG
jgi:ABC-type branched-subunit amino acid transport system ATPase component